MPRYRPETERAKAESLAKSCIKHNFNQSRVAKELGVSHQAVNERLHSKPVQKTLAEYLQKSFSRKYVRTKFKDGLEAKKVVGYLNNKVAGAEKISDEFIEVDDLYCRHKYLITLLECEGLLKHNGNGNGVSVVNVIYGYRRPIDSAIRPD